MKKIHIFKPVFLGMLVLACAFSFVPSESVSAEVYSQTTLSTGCVVLTSNLYFGASDRFISGGNVARLQNFLIAEGHLKYSGAKGFYGGLTFAAVKRFQRDNGILAIGLVGPVTRARIQALTCGTVPPVPPVSNTPTVISLSPSAGTYGTVVTVYGSGFARYNNSINYAGRTGAVTGVESSNGTSLQFTIPATPCSSGMFCAQVVMAPGMYPVSVTNQNATSNSMNFTLTSGVQSVNQSVTVGIGQSVAVSGTPLQIRAVRVTEESRCPVGVYCIQAGRVVVETNIQSHDMIQVANLSFGGGTDSQSSVVVDGYTVRITGVTPQARQGGVNSWEYLITYQIVK